MTANDYVHAALEHHKREGHLLAVRARWIALAVIAVLLVSLNPSVEVLYYHGLLLAFALLGWVQLQIGRVGSSRPELFLLFCDLALMTFVSLVPNPFHDEGWPITMQYHFNNFMYFYVLLAAATLAYSWRTVFAVGTWTSGLWLTSMGLILWLFNGDSALSERVRAAVGPDTDLAWLLDPNAVNVGMRVQEVVVFMIVAVILGLSSRRFNMLVLAQADAARQRANLTRYFAPSMVEELVARDRPFDTVRHQDAAVLFADIVGFTKLAEHSEPDEIVETLRAFHERMERAVFDNHGTLDKFLGDGLMATFGTPEPDPHCAARALSCAADMLAAVDAWNAERRGRGEPEIRISIGAHVGPVVIGDIGSARRLEFAVIGDTVNVAARLEAITRDLSVNAAFSAPLVEAAKADDGVDCAGLLSRLRDGGTATLRGRDEPTGIHCIAS